MSNLFITNQGAKDLGERLRELVRYSSELKFLVGFFYFSGWAELYEALRDRLKSGEGKCGGLKIKILVGLSPDRKTGELVEIAKSYQSQTQNQIRKYFLEELKEALSDPSLDFQEFPEQARFFLRLLQEGCLELKKTKQPNHAKLYLFKLKEEHRSLLNQSGKFITGSSNLTKAGLTGQHEFNVEISDYGFEEAERYFDELWRTAVPVTPETIAGIKRIIERASLAALPTPFELYAFLVKGYLDLLSELPHREGPASFLKRAGYEPHVYQLDAVELALRILKEYGGVILADVVGLGKSVVACLIAREAGGRGIVIAPPKLLGDETTYGWKKYLSDFGLYDWRTFSIGKLEEALEFLRGPGKDVETVIVDEAHIFRNPDTERYALLQAITSGRRVILLTATPFNNTPWDVYALLRLFITPGSSKLGPTSDLEDYFRKLKREFEDYSYILRYYDSRISRRKKRAERLYKYYFSEASPVNTRKVRRALNRVAQEVRLAMSPVTIRRNRLDLERDPRYRDRRPAFPQLKDPEPLFYELSPEQSRFFDQVIEWFSDEDGFRGAIYQPFFYERGIFEEDLEDTVSQDDLFVAETQRNLAEFMRRLLVRRFESSFGAFIKTVERLVKLHERVLEFIKKTGYHLLDRKELLELVQMLEEDNDEALERVLERIEKLFEEDFRASDKRRKVYRIEDFAEKDAFINDIRRDLELLKQIASEADRLELANPEKDPKAARLAEFIKERLAAEPRRKIVIFSEFTDTVAHVGRYLQNAGLRVLEAGANLGPEIIRKTIENFDASVSADKQKDDYDVLVASDRLSEGINLHRAGMVINYDIPWNPTRLIQRIGRINRVGHKIFEELYIYHFFPTEKGAEVVDSKEVAQHKLYLIHKALGEDAKIISPDEEPTPARIYHRLTELPEDEGESFDTWIRLEWERIKGIDAHIEEKISEFPNRIKTARFSEEGTEKVLLFVRKGLGFFAYVKSEDADPEPLGFPEALEMAKCTPDTPRAEFSQRFWQAYKDLEELSTSGRASPPASNSLERFALHNLQTARQKYREFFTPEELNFIEKAVEDIRYYKRLPRYALRLLQEFDLKDDRNIEQFKANLTIVIKRFGQILTKAPPKALPTLIAALEVRKE